MSSSTVQNIEIVQSSDAKTLLDVLKISPEFTDIPEIIVRHFEDASVVLKLCCTCKNLSNISKKLMSSWLEGLLPWNSIEELTIPFRRINANFTFDSGVTAC